MVSYNDYTIAITVQMYKLISMMVFSASGALQIASAVPGLMGSVSTGSMPDSDRNTPVS